MKIIFVTPSPFPYYSGGVETWMYNVIKRVSSDYEIKVIAPKPGKNATTIFSDILDKAIYDYFYTLERKFIFRNRLIILAQLLKRYTIRKKLNKEKLSSEDVVICVEPVICGNAIVRLKKNKKFRFMISLRTPHSEVMSSYYPYYSDIYYSWEKEALKGSDMILANGEDTIEIYKKLTGRQLYLMKNGVNLERFLHAKTENAYGMNEDNNEEFSIVSVATLIPIKGVYKLIDSLAILQQKTNIKNIKVYFVGKGNIEKLMEYAKRRNVDKYVVCLGEKRNVQDYMAKASLNICLSGGSGLSMSMIEALASKKPIVALNTPVYQQFDKYKKLCLAEDNPESIADAINTVYSNYDYYKKIAEQYYSVASEYDWSIVCKQFLQYVEQIKNDIND